MAVNTDRSLRRHITAGFLSMIIMLGLAGGWSVYADISGAVIAPATLMVESYSKKIQHKEGGIVKEILVKDGDRVVAGQDLIILDDTDTKSDLGIIEALLVEFFTKRARLEAQRDDATTIVYPDEVIARQSEPDVARVMLGQQNLFDSRAAALHGKLEQLTKQVGQLSEQIGGLSSQEDSKAAQTELIDEELGNLKKLRKQGLVPATRVLAMQRERARLGGEIGEIVASKASAEAKIAEIKVQMIQIQDESRSQTLTELRDVESRISELQERRLAARAKLARTAIKAPIAGDVYQLNLHTIGGVIAPGEGLMLLVPDADELVLQAQVFPKDIDQVMVGQKAMVRFPSLNARLTPEIGAEVIQVSADISRVDQTTPPFYAVRLRIPHAELAKLGEAKLKPGMPAEAFIQTSAHSPISYLLKPLADQIAHTFRET